MELFIKFPTAHVYCESWGKFSVLVGFGETCWLLRTKTFHTNTVKKLSSGKGKEVFLGGVSERAGAYSDNKTWGPGRGGKAEPVLAAVSCHLESGLSQLALGRHEKELRRDEGVLQGAELVCARGTCLIKAALNESCRRVCRNTRYVLVKWISSVPCTQNRLVNCPNNFAKHYMC